MDEHRYLSFSIFGPLRMVFALLAPLLITGCVSIDSTRTSPEAFHAIKADDVYVFQRESEAPPKFTSVAIIYTAANANFQNEAKAIQAAKKRAGELGANGIIVGGFSEPSEGIKFGSALLGVRTSRKGQIHAIHFEPTVK